MADIRDFKKCVEDCSLLDLKSTGAFFTWTNKQSGGDIVLSRIDRVMVNAGRGLNLPASVVHYRNEGLVRQGPIISAIQRTQLEEQFNENEVKKALWAIAGDKAPGPDGFDSQFFKDGWEVVGKDVVEVVLESGRSNVQKILICQDLVRLYNRKATTKSYLIKIDLNKAYDSVEWGFVEEMLYAMNIPVKFINWVMNCISTTQYNIALNGDLYGNIQGKHGLR
ncbi:uncharacterized protein [Nicotiana tomentosiformis]|uniref:uncharacterized protein n=1 Tax=Nicotiana tomentosiformis TaxID=4098 RepID=UPI00388CBBAE